MATTVQHILMKTTALYELHKKSERRTTNKNQHLKLTSHAEVSLANV